MHRPLPRFCAAAPALLLASLAAGCAAPGDFPSLQPRPIERALAEADAAPDPVPAPADAETVGKAEALLGKIQGGGRDFGALLPAGLPRRFAPRNDGSETRRLLHRRFMRLGEGHIMVDAHHVSGLLFLAEIADVLRWPPRPELPGQDLPPRGEQAARREHSAALVLAAVHNDRAEPDEG